MTAPSSQAVVSDIRAAIHQIDIRNYGLAVDLLFGAIRKLADDEGSRTMGQSEFKPGDALMVRTASDEWRPKIADSEVEGLRSHAQRHDFVGVYVREPDGAPGDSIFWPIEDVRSR